MSNYAANFTIVTRASLPPYSYWENTNSETNIEYHLQKCDGLLRNYRCVHFVTQWTPKNT